MAKLSKEADKSITVAVTQQEYEEIKAICEERVKGLRAVKITPTAWTVDVVREALRQHREPPPPPAAVPVPPPVKARGRRRDA